MRPLSVWKPFKACAAACAAALLAGCATLLEEAASPGSELVFSAKGNVITQVGSEPPQRVRFRWHRTEKASEAKDSLLVMSPEGVALFRIERSASTLTFKDATGRTVEGDEAKAVLKHRTGWDLPVEEAAYWIQCKPHPLRSAVERVTLNKNRIIEQEGWEILCSRYDENGMPVAIRLENRNSVLQIAISEWTI